MTLPTADEINVYGSLDEILACEHFLNKTLEEAEKLFQDNSSYYQEDLMWMGPRAFHFYIQAVTNYLLSADANGDEHMIDCLYEIVRFRLTQKDFCLAISRVNAMINHIIRDYDKFGVNEKIYGDLKGKYAELQEQINDMTNSNKDTEGSAFDNPEDNQCGNDL